MISKTALDDDKYHVSNESINYDERTQVINHYDTFCIFDRRGNIHPDVSKAQGIFYKGTRYLNNLDLRINGLRPVLLSSSIRQDNEVLSVDLANPDMRDSCKLLENVVHICREQFIRNGIFYEELRIVNFNLSACDFEISLEFGADFCDIFEVRGVTRTVERSKVSMSIDANSIRFDYTGLDNLYRSSIIRFCEETGFYIVGNKAIFPLSIDSRESKIIRYVIHFNRDEEPDAGTGPFPEFSEVKKSIQKEIHDAKSRFADITSNNENFNNWLIRSQTDMQSLLAHTEHGLYPYAGVPWYNTSFGRDGIITAMEMLWAAPHIARDVLIFLANTQAQELNAEKDAEPGKIIHEMRSGEMANTGEVPFDRYYGTIDATPLFLMLAGMYYMQTADLETIKKIWKNIKAAIIWIDEYGDIDGDGFVEYKNKSSDGLDNQGWKDSRDSIMYADGNLCKAPIALCEVQGYVYAAKKYGAMLASQMGEMEYAQQLTDAAETLYEKFDEFFWDEEMGTYVLALDGDKNPCRVLSSNAGHCLFTGIAKANRAEILAARLTGKEMFSGWGIRTLANSEVRYNPMSYHNGTIWPHDNAIIAMGLARYGYLGQSLKVFHGLFDASMFIELQRLPELFCGLERRIKEGPTAYPVACSPQAWAVGSVFLLLQACLQIQIDGSKKTIVFNKPRLPEFIKHISISNLSLGGDQHCHFEAFRHKDEISFRILYKPKDWEFIIKQ